MFVDWNGNGRKDDTFDNFMDFEMLRHMSDGGGGGNSGPCCCGVCCLYMLAVPAGIIGVIIGIAKLLA